MQNQNLTFESLKTLLAEVFNDGEFTPERVVVVILLCADILNVTSLTPSFSAISRRMFTWILDFIRNQVCVWVNEHGGWVSLL